MINDLAVYLETGRKAAIARREHDESRAAFFADWALRAIRLEAPEDQPAARAAYRTGYRGGSYRHGVILEGGAL